MPLPNNALVLVTDGRKTLFFRNHGDENQIDLRTEAHDEREDLQQQRDEDRCAGRDRAVGGLSAARPMRKPTSTSRRKTAGSRMRRTRSTSARSPMISTRWRSSPRPSARRVRKELHKEAERRVVCEIHKEMTGRPIPDIEALLVGETQGGGARRF